MSNDLATIATWSVPKLIEWGKQAIEQAGTFEEVKDLRAKAEALATYQRSIGAADEAVLAAMELRHRAERHMGQELAARLRATVAPVADDSAALVWAALAIEEVFGPDLRQDAVLEGQLTTALTRIVQAGVRAALPN